MEGSSVFRSKAVEGVKIYTMYVEKTCLLFLLPSRWNSNEYDNDDQKEDNDEPVFAGARSAIDNFYALGG